MVKNPASLALLSAGAQRQGHLLRLWRVHQQVLVQIALRHVLEDQALRLVLEHHPQQADDVRVPQVRHQLTIALEVPSRRLVRSDLERLDGDEGAAAANNAAKLSTVNFPEDPVAHLLDEPDRRDGELSGSHLGQLVGLLLVGQQGVHLHL